MQLIEWQLAPKSLSLTRDEIHIWRAFLDSPALVSEEWSSILSKDELERADRFKFERDRIHFIVARGILRRLLGVYTGLPPAHLRFHYGAQGKPALVTTQKISFNLAHSQEVAVYAFGRERELGIDVEWIRPEIVSEELAIRSFTPREMMAWRALPPPMKSTEFFVHWTCKEAYTKAEGLGLGLPFDGFELELNGETGKIRLQGDDTEWRVVPILAAESYPAALVHQGEASAIRFFSV